MHGDDRHTGRARESRGKALVASVVAHSYRRTTRLSREVGSSFMAKPWRRRSGVIRRSGILGARPGSAFFGSPDVLDGGEDAPISARGRLIFRATILAILAAGFVLIAVAIRSN
jgi:hypothetical protein